MVRDVSLQSLFYTSSRVPINEDPPSSFPSRSSLRERERERKKETLHL
jgi:hypothetical protein